MKLNPDCARDLMFFLEDRTKVEFRHECGHVHAAYCEFCPALLRDGTPLEKYDLGEIFYHVVQLSEAGYISTDYVFDPLKGDGGFRLSRVYYVTPKGHDFIAATRDEKTWDNTLKPLFAAIGSVSLSVIESVASGVTSAVIDKWKSQHF